MCMFLQWVWSRRTCNVTDTPITFVHFAGLGNDDFAIPSEHWDRRNAARTIQEWRERLGLVDPLRFRAGSTLFNAGLPATHIYLLARGIAKLTHELNDGRGVLLMLAYPGYLLNVSSAGPSSASLLSGIAATPCEAYRLESQMIDEAARRDVALAKLLHRCLRTELSRWTASMVEILSLSPAERLERRLDQIATVLGCYRSPGRPIKVPVPLNDGDLAMMLGVSTRHFKRLKRSLHESGRLIWEAKRICILFPIK